MLSECLTVLIMHMLVNISQVYLVLQKLVMEKVGGVLQYKCNVYVFIQR